MTKQDELIQKLAAMMICKELIEKEIQEISSMICKHPDTEYLGQGFRRCKDCDSII